MYTRNFTVLNLLTVNSQLAENWLGILSSLPLGQRQILNHNIQVISDDHKIRQNYFSWKDNVLILHSIPDTDDQSENEFGTMISLYNFMSKIQRLSNKSVNKSLISKINTFVKICPETSFHCSFLDIHSGHERGLFQTDSLFNYVHLPSHTLSIWQLREGTLNVLHHHNKHFVDHIHEIKCFRHDYKAIATNDEIQTNLLPGFDCRGCKACNNIWYSINIPLAAPIISAILETFPKIKSIILLYYKHKGFKGFAEWFFDDIKSYLDIDRSHTCEITCYDPDTDSTFPYALVRTDIVDQLKIGKFIK